MKTDPDWSEHRGLYGKDSSLVSELSFFSNPAYPCTFLQGRRSVFLFEIWLAFPPLIANYWRGFSLWCIAIPGPILWNDENDLLDHRTDSSYENQ
jgi:hypothetical protein